MKFNKQAEKWIGNPGTIRLSIDLDPEMHKKLKSLATEESETMAVIVRRLIKKHLSK